MLGDLKGASSLDAVFTTKINSSAVAGIYRLSLIVNYSYLYLAEQYGGETIRYTYRQVNESIDIPIKIKSEISLDVLSVTPEHLNVGSEGYLNLKIRNTGYEDGTNAVVKILSNNNSPVVPNDSSVYIGDFPSGSTIDARYTVSVSPDAENQTYPADVVVEYTDKEGNIVTSRSDTIGIPVGRKVDFEIISPASDLNPGNKKSIQVEYKNTGETKVYRAQARISAIDPFTSMDDVAYLGDLNPGDSVVASYIVSVDRSATVKEYGLDAEIRYQDALNATYISDIKSVKINVNSPVGLTAVLTNPVYLFIIAAGIIGILYLVYQYRKKLSLI
jgi:hypothetical protein